MDKIELEIGYRYNTTRKITYYVGDVIYMFRKPHCVISEIGIDDQGEYFKIIRIIKSNGAFKKRYDEHLYRPQQNILENPPCTIWVDRDDKLFKSLLSEIEKEIGVLYKLPKQIEDQNPIEFARDVLSKKDNFYKKHFGSTLMKLVKDKIIYDALKENQHVFEYIKEHLSNNNKKG